MRVPASSLRSLVLLRAGVVGDSSRPVGGSRRSESSWKAPAQAGLPPWVTRVLVPLLLLAALAACDTPSPTGPDESGSGSQVRTSPEGRPERPNHLVANVR